MPAARRRAVDVGADREDLLADRAPARPAAGRRPDGRTPRPRRRAPVASGSGRRVSSGTDEHREIADRVEDATTTAARRVARRVDDRSSRAPPRRRARSSRRARCRDPAAAVLDLVARLAGHLTIERRTAASTGASAASSAASPGSGGVASGSSADGYGASAIARPHAANVGG